MALPSTHRLRQRQAFDAIYKRGRRYTASLLLLRTLRRPQDGPTQLGVVISTKVDKRAVRRNRLRRQIHAAFLSLRPRLEPGWLLLVTVRPGQDPCDYPEILQELELLLIQAKVLHGRQ